MSRSGCISIATAFLTIAQFVGEPTPAAPPPPGWAEAYRSRVCTTARPATTFDLGVRDVPPRDAGIRLAKHAPITVAWAADLELPKDVDPVGITVTYGQGVLLLTSDGRWVQIAAPNAPIQAGTAEAHAIADGTRPKRISSEADGTVATIQQDGSTIARYDLKTCGYGAKAQPAFRLSQGSVADAIAQVDPNLGGFARNRYILVAGGSDGHPGQLASWPVDGGDVERPFEDSFVKVPDGSVLALLAAFDLAGGCDAVAGMRDARGRTTVVTFCKPDHSDEPVMLLGDVGVSGTRSPKSAVGQIPLAVFSVPVIGAAVGPWLKDGRMQLLVLAKASNGTSRVVSLSGEPARYRTR